jgi:MYXO-CTERM domain-containing protein
MKKLLMLLNAAVICCFLATCPVIAQDANRPDNTQVDSDDDDTDYGWIGLIGLAGLLGLRKRDRVDRDYTTTGRPNTGNNPR